MELFCRVYRWRLVFIHPSNPLLTMNMIKISSLGVSICCLLLFSVAGHGEEQLVGKLVPEDRPILNKWQAAFLKADKIELFSLKELDNQEKHDLPKLHHYYILGSVVIDKRDEQQQLLDELPKYIIEKEPAGFVGCIFNPRHAIRLHVEDQKHDILLCFECSLAKLESATLPLPKYMDGLAANMEVLDKLLKKYKVPMNPERK